MKRNVFAEKTEKKRSRQQYQRNVGEDKVGNKAVSDGLNPPPPPACFDIQLSVLLKVLF